MSGDYSRAERVGTAIQRELSELVMQLKDPHLGLVTIQEARVSRDLSVAKIYFTVLDAEPKETQKRLQKAAGFLRHELGRTSTMSTVPEMRFVFDTSIEYGNRLQSLIEEAVNKDNKEKD